MARKDKKQKHAKKRRQARKHQKARVRSQPKLLRKDPVLKAALNYRHPLVGCLINENWQEYRMANVYVIRESPYGLVLANFLVDIAGAGLKDAWGGYGYSKADIEDLKAQIASRGDALVSCDLSLVHDVVHGGVIWARKWKFKLPKGHAIWLRLLEPVDLNDIRLDLFGENGRPLLIRDEDDVHQLVEEQFNPQILKDDLAVDADGLPPATLDRIKDIKTGLIIFSRRLEFREDFGVAVKDHFGEAKPESDFEWINFQDWFILQHELADGTTIIQRFAGHYKKHLGQDVRRLLEGWRLVIEGLFEVKDRDHAKTYMRNLINEREYSVYATTSMEQTKLNPGDFVTARIVPALGFHVFSGSLSVTPTDGSQKQKAQFYRTALDIQMKYPARAFLDNELKLQKSRQAVRDQYDDFTVFFGTDEIFGSGPEILRQYQAFFDYQIFEKVSPGTGLTPAASYEQDTGKAYEPPQVRLPEDLLESDDVAMLCDPKEGLSFLIQYRQFLDIFQNPDLHLEQSETVELIADYLASEWVSDTPFRRAAGRFPANFREVMAYLGLKMGFEAVEIDALMREFKPDSFDKLPATIVVLDSEISSLAKLAAEKPVSAVGGMKRIWGKIKKKL